jgi:Domain of unknown function (DUF4173)
MLSNSVILKAIIMATLAFNFLFWQEKIGLNILLFDLLIGASIYFLHPEKWKEKTVLITFVSTLLLAFLIVWNNTLFSKTIHFFSALCFLGFVQVKQMEFIGSGFGLGLCNLLEGPMKAVIAAKAYGSEIFRRHNNLQPAWRWLQLSVVPMGLVVIFYSLYILANPAFAKLSGEAWGKIIPWVTPNVSGYRLVFFIAGFIFSSALLWSGLNSSNFREKHRDKTLLRKREARMNFKTLDLKMEYRSALILILALNMLLAIVNAIDFWYVWIGYDVVNPKLLSNYVHEGTWLLIMAILLGMMVLGYYFRKNLNFLAGNTLLKSGAYLWIIQNGILAISVGVRNFKYIEYYGLAYKRLGVILFLMMVMIGLFTMFVKVQRRKSFYYLLYQNAWACYFVLIFASCVNWDVLITQYNLSGKSKTELDISYLVSGLSDKNLYLLLQHFPEEKGLGNLDNGLVNHLKNKTVKFLAQQNSYTWLSWNYSDYKNKRFLASETN